MKIHIVSNKQSESKVKWNYFEYFVKAGYYTLVLPYNVKRNKLTGQLEIVNDGKLHKCLVFLIWLSSIVRAVALFRDAWERAEEKRFDLLSYFIISKTLTLLALLIYYQWRVMKGQNLLQELIQNVQFCSLLQDSGERRIFGWILVAGIHIALMLLRIVQQFSSVGWTFSGFYRSSFATGEYALFLVHNSTSIHKFDSVILNSFIGAIGFPIKLSFVLIYPYFNSLLCICSITILEAATKFVDDLKKYVNYTNKISHIQSNYTELLNLSSSINSVWSRFCLVLLFNELNYLCTILHPTLLGKDYVGKCRIFLQFAYTGIGCFFSAKCYRLNGKFITYLVEGLNPENVNSKDLEILMEKAKHGSIGIGTKDLFQLDYKMIFEMIVTALTFYFIFLQSYTIGREIHRH